MSIMTAHRILIALAVALCVFYAAWEFRRFGESADPWAAVISLVSCGLAVGLAIYWRTIPRR